VVKTLKLLFLTPRKINIKKGVKKMKKRKTFIGMALVIAILILGVGYAAITNINLLVTGTANVTANSDFVVEFDTNHEVVVTNNAEGAYAENKLEATMTVNLDANTTSQTAIYKIDNKSEELGATLATTVDNSDADLSKYVDITSEICTDSSCSSTLTGTLIKGESAYLKVTATLKKNPAQDVLAKTFTVTVTATPVDA
jgi:hypothetical protein